MNQTIDHLMKNMEELSKRNDEQSDKHRIAYGNEKYNQGIDDAIELIANKMLPDCSPELLLCGELISELQKLKHQ